MRRFTSLLCIVSLVILQAGCSFLPKKYAPSSLYVRETTPEDNWEMALGIEKEYLIDVGDMLDISVWQIEEMHKEVIVRPDGKISFPLIGEVKAEDKTPVKLAEEIEAKLSYYIKKPNVLVGVKEFGGKKVFILGEVSNPGLYRFSYEAQLIEVISMAGGYTQGALIKNTKIIRGGLEDPEVISINLAKLIRKGDMRQNVSLKNGDIIYVPSTPLSNLGYILEEIQPLFDAFDSYQRVDQYQQLN